jgi:predicted TIM-barrel fold metal-dependent hydrolase
VLFGGQHTFSRRAHPHTDLEPVACQLRAAYTARRLLWASDFPWTWPRPGYARTVELVDCGLPGLAPGERAAVLGGTAGALFGL